MESTVDLVNYAIAGDRDAALAAFNSAIAAKVTDALEVKKIEMASTLLTPEEETTDEPTEVETEVDGTTDANDAEVGTETTSEE